MSLAYLGLDFSNVIAQLKPTLDATSAALAQYTGPRTPGVLVTLPTGIQGRFAPDGQFVWGADPSGYEQVYGAGSSVSGGGSPYSVAVAPVAARKPTLASITSTAGGKSIVPWLLIGGVALVGGFLLLRRR